MRKAHLKTGPLEGNFWRKIFFEPNLTFPPISYKSYSIMQTPPRPFYSISGDLSAPSAETDKGRRTFSDKPKEQAHEESRTIPLPRWGSTFPPKPPPQKWVTTQDYCQKAKELLNKKEWRSAQVILEKGAFICGQNRDSSSSFGSFFLSSRAFLKGL